MAPGPHTAQPALPRLHFVPCSAASRSPQPPPLAATSGTARGSSNATPAHLGKEALPRVTPPPHPAALRYPAVARHGPGLHNVGNSCYANATLQALLHNPAVLYIAARHARAPHPRAAQRTFCALCALRALARHVHPAALAAADADADTHDALEHRQQLQQQQDSCQKHRHGRRGGGNGAGGFAFGGGGGGAGAAAVTPSMFVDPHNLRQISRAFQHSRQEDAHEFLRGLLDAATRSALLGCGAPLPSSGALPLSHDQETKSVVHAACGGILQSGVRCHACGHESVTLEPFLDLSIGTAPTLERALDRFTAPDKLDGNNMYHCESCRKKVVASKRLTIRTAPNSLTIHLKRFDGYRKDRSDVRYPSTLNIAPYMIRPSNRSAATSKRASPSSPPIMYQLVGVLVHDGPGTRSGHYYSYVKGSNGTWCLKNDSSSSTVAESRALRQQAYILFYSREPDPIRAPVEAGVALRPSAAGVIPAKAAPPQIPLVTGKRSAVTSEPKVPCTALPIHCNAPKSVPQHSDSPLSASIDATRKGQQSFDKLPAPVPSLTVPGFGHVLAANEPSSQDPAGSSNSSDTGSGTDPDSSTQDENPFEASRCSPADGTIANEAASGLTRSPQPRPGKGTPVLQQTAKQSKEESFTPTPAATSTVPPSAICQSIPPVKTDEFPQSPKWQKQQVPEPRSAQSFPSDESACEAEKEVSGFKTPFSSLRMSDAHSGQGSSSLRSLHSGLSADNSEASRDSGVRAFIAGSGRAVRKFAQRLLNYVGSSPDPSRAGRSDRRGLSSSSSSGCIPSDSDASGPEGVSTPSLRAFSPRLSGRSAESARRIASPKKMRPQPNIGAAVSEMHCLPDSSEVAGESTLGKRSRVAEGGVVFKDLGIGGWGTPTPNLAPPQPILGNGVRGSRPLPKRARARDLTDAEYDRGKPKKVKRARPGNGAARSGGASVNPFQAAAERRRSQGMR